MERELVGSRPLTVEDKQAILITLIGIKLDTEILNNLLCSTMCNYKTKQIPLNHLTSYSDYFHYVSKFGLCFIGLISTVKLHKIIFDYVSLW